MLTGCVRYHQAPKPDVSGLLTGRVRYHLGAAQTGESQTLPMMFKDYENLEHETKHSGQDLHKFWAQTDEPASTREIRTCPVYRPDVSGFPPRKPPSRPNPISIQNSTKSTPATTRFCTLGRKVEERLSLRDHRPIWSESKEIEEIPQT